MSIIIFNGPPKSGKDEAASYFKRRGFAHLSFKHQLFKETINEFDVDAIWFMDGFNDRSTKERPEDELRGMSRREAMIHTSEDVIKPKYGKSFFGDKVAEELDIGNEYVISDGGFVEELEPIIDKIGEENILLIQLVRDNCTYENDSRRYFNGYCIKEFINGYKSDFQTQYLLETEMPLTTYRIYNNGTLSGFHHSLEKIYEMVIGREDETDS